MVNGSMSIERNVDRKASCDDSKSVVMELCVLSGAKVGLENSFGQTGFVGP
jgi:hypothetical protein